ncbi:MAG: HNH endonuclease [Nitrospira sp.]
MPRRSQPKDPTHLRAKLDELLNKFEKKLGDDGLRDQVRALIPVFHTVRDLGASLVPIDGRASGSKRLLAYLRRHVGVVVAGDELMVIGGIGEYARRIRELRKESGWPILSGVAAREIRGDAESQGALFDDDLPPQMKVDDYLLVEDAPDLDAARRWKLANDIRRRKDAVKTKILHYLRANVGQRITSEELRYLANDKSEWARRTRQLRTEDGWPVVTRQSGDPNLPVGVYILAADQQAPAHDRNIKELTRRKVLARDHWRCQWKGCGWSVELRDKDPRFLEAHHVHEHAKGGSNEAENLVTLCNLHHDEVHRIGELLLEDSAAANLGVA